MVICDKHIKFLMRWPLVSQSVSNLHFQIFICPCFHWCQEVRWTTYIYIHHAIYLMEGRPKVVDRHTWNCFTKLLARVTSIVLNGRKLCKKTLLFIKIFDLVNFMVSLVLRWFCYPVMLQGFFAGSIKIVLIHPLASSSPCQPSSGRHILEDWALRR